MTSDAFNDKYADYLEDRHYGLAINRPEVIQMLDELFQLFILMPGFSYSQIKLKYGMARFYAQLPGSVSCAVEKRIDALIKQSELSNSP